MSPIPPKARFDAAHLESIDRHKLLIGLVVPRPIGWIGSIGSNGVANLAPFSFFNVIAATPPTVVFSAGRRRGTEKDTAANVSQNGEFTVNIVTEHTVEAMNLTAADVEPEVDEFELAGVSAVPADVVAAPLVAEALANFECTVTEIVELGDPPTNAVVFGEVVRLHVAESVLDGTRVDPFELRAVGRMAGGSYTRTVDGYFELRRPG